MTWEAVNVSFGYGRELILDRVSVSVAPGEVVGLLGPSGQGKSTLGKIMAGWLRGYRGQVLLDGAEAPARGRRPDPIQYLNQNPESAINPRWRMERVLNEGWPVDQATLSAMGIERPWLTRFSREISGGEMQRFCIARALHPDLRYLVADEMTTMLDPVTQAQIWARLTGIVRARTIGMLVITHNLALAERLCDRCYELADLQG